MADMVALGLACFASPPQIWVINRLPAKPKGEKRRKGEEEKRSKGEQEQMFTFAPFLLFSFSPLLS
jgi:hypothetical protein